MIKVAILSYWHVHAQDYTNDTLNHPDTEVVAVWDEIPERGQKKPQNSVFLSTKICMNYLRILILMVS